MRPCAWFLVLGLCALRVDAAVIRVDARNVSGIEDGLSWVTAYATLQAAVDVALPGDELWVVAGGYGETRSALDGALTLSEGVVLYGGFAGGETARDERDAVTNVTVIDGAASRLGEPARHVLLAANETRLDGFTIRGGRANAGGAAGNYGGGLLVAGVSMTVVDCVFEGNEGVLGGAAAHVGGGTVLFERAVFRNNGASSYGGAIYDEGETRYQDCTFRENYAFMGGGLALYEGAIALADCVFEQNRALSRDGGALWVNFGGIAECDRTRFTGNLAETDGGAVANWSGTVRLRNAIFRDNRTTRAGGAVFTLALVELDHCTVWKNTAKSDSAAVVSNGGSIVAVNSDFWGNAPASVLNLSVQPADVVFSNVEGGYPGEGNIDVAPGYRDPDNGDFRPRPDSPLIDMGTDVEGVDTDYRGLPRPSGAGFDIGAAEFFDWDGDWMEDDWEVDFGLDPSDPSDGAGDLDDDGLDNAREFALDTDPADAEDPVREFFVAMDGDDANPGTEDAPFLTIGRAVAVARSFGNTRTIHVGAGLYQESVVLPGGLMLAGAGSNETEIQHYDAADARHVVIEMGERSTLQDCRVSFPPLQAALGVLVSMQAVGAQLQHVVIDGGDSLLSVGVSVRGEGETPGAIRDARIRRVQVGIQTLDSAVVVAQCAFEGIRGDAVLVNLPDRKQGGSARVPVLGRANDPGTGRNVFGSVVGYFVVNLTDVTVQAESNNWGLSFREDIQAKMYGPVDFQPFNVSKETALFYCGVVSPAEAGALSAQDSGSRARPPFRPGDGLVLAAVVFGLSAADFYRRRRIVVHSQMAFVDVAPGCGRGPHVDKS